MIKLKSFGFGSSNRFYDRIIPHAAAIQVAGGNKKRCREAVPLEDRKGDSSVLAYPSSNVIASARAGKLRAFSESTAASNGMTLNQFFTQPITWSNRRASGSSGKRGSVSGRTRWKIKMLSLGPPSKRRVERLS